MSEDIQIKYSSAFATAHSRDYYRGKSFRNAGAWTSGEHYTCDEYNVDFVYYRNIFLACTKSHLASAELEPNNWIFDADGEVIGVDSNYWTLVVAGRKGDKGKVYIPQYNSTTGVLTWNLISDENAVPVVDFDLELTSIINAAIAAAEDATEDAIAATSNANDAASSAHDAAESANDAASAARDIVSDITHILDGIIAQTTGTGTTVVMSQKATTDELNKKADKLTTFTVDNLMTVGAGGGLKDSGIAKTVITGLQTDISNLQTAISGNDGILSDISDINTRLSQLNYAYTGKGTKATVSALPSSGNHEGDVWKVTETDAHYVWTGSEWDKLSETVDLTPYITATQISSTYLTKTDAASTYLTKTNAASTYLNKIDAANTYLTSNQIYSLTLKYGDEDAVVYNPTTQARWTFTVPAPTHQTIYPLKLSINNGSSTSVTTYVPNTAGPGTGGAYEVSITAGSGGGGGIDPSVLSNYVTLVDNNPQTVAGIKKLQRISLLSVPHAAPANADVINGETYLWINTSGNYSVSPFMNITTQAPSDNPASGQAYLYYDTTNNKICVKVSNGTVYTITLTAE